MLTKAEEDDYPARDNIKLIDTLVPFLILWVEARKHNKLIDKIEYPGIISTIKGTVISSQPETVAQRNSGFESIYSGGGKFFISGALSNFDLNFFEDINIPVYKGGFTLSFTRAGVDDAIFRFTKKNNEISTLAKAQKITINEFRISIPIIDFETTSNIQLLNELEKLNSSGQNVIEIQVLARY